MKSKYNITIGSDPEVFICKEDGEIVSAIGLVPGSKHEPHPIDEEGHFIQTDNIALEYNIPPCNSKEDFIYHIHYVKDYLEALMAGHGYKLSTKASDEIDPQYLKHPQARTLGCQPDLNPYTKSLNPPPNAKGRLRSVGGHLSCGYDNPNQEISEKIVKTFDIYLTLPSLLIDTDERRRELYGKAGAFRFTDYGVECRCLSNFWIHSKELTAWAYDRFILAIECVLDGNADELINKYSEKVVEAINTNNKELAKELISEIFQEQNVLV